MEKSMGMGELESLLMATSRPSATRNRLPLFHRKQTFPRPRL